jgi:hypothetical protein
MVGLGCFFMIKNYQQVLGKREGFRSITPEFDGFLLHYLLFFNAILNYFKTKNIRLLAKLELNKARWSDIFIIYFYYK